MRKIIFITGNKGKLKEAQEIIPGITAKDIDLPEIQEVDAKKVIEAKLKEARRCHKGEYMVEDTLLYFDCLNGLPGPLIKWFLERLGDKKLFLLTQKFNNPKAEAKTIIGYINKKGRTEFFEGKIKGKIVSPKGKNGFGWDRIFAPEGGEKTFAQMSLDEKNKISMRKIALQKFADNLKKAEK